MRTLNRATLILQILADHDEPVRVTEIAEKAGMPISTVHRILSGLVVNRLVIQNSVTRKYSPGYGLVRLAQSASNGFRSYVDATAHLAEVRDTWDECAFIAALRDNQVLCIQTIEVDNPNRTGFYVRQGRIMPFNCSASGKVILAYQTMQKIEDILNSVELYRFTPTTITGREELKRHLSIIKRHGYAVSREEHEIGVDGVAVPVIEASGKVNSCIAVVAPSARLRNHLKNGLTDMMIDVSKNLSLLLHDTSAEVSL